MAAPTSTAPEPTARTAPLRLLEENGAYLLPGGYLDSRGVVHREVELQPLSGKLEELLASAPSGLCSAGLVTRVLAQSITRLGSLPQVTTRIVRGMLAGDRDYLVVQLRRITFGEKFEAMIKCPDSACGSTMIIPILLDEIPIEGEPVVSGLHRLRLASGSEVVFRLPTGEDQETLAQAASADEDAAVIQLLARCIRSVGANKRIGQRAVRRLSASDCRQIEERMRQLSPCVQLELEIACPDCAARFYTQLSLAALCLSEMKADLSQLEREVHFLAWHYHWGAQEILSMTRPKRRRYVSLIENEIEALKSE